MPKKQSKIKRTFVMGDEWLYYKFYCGPKTADFILTEIVKPAAEKLLAENVIDKWFFIRYSDPKLHVRVRFHYTNPENIFPITETVKYFSNQYIEQNLIWKIQVDTYQREIERYGANTMSLSEDLFFHDSTLIVNMLDRIEGDEGEIIRWLFSLRAIDTLLDDFSYSEEEKLNLLESLKTGFGKEFGMERSLKSQLDKKFRAERTTINSVLDKTQDDKNEMQPLFKLLENKSIISKPAINTILELNREKKLEKSLDNLMGSYIHMLMNRLFKSKQRAHEMVVYDFLCRYYKSEWAKKKYAKQELVNI